ncbi:MAG: hypothetical protein LUD46_06365 [Parabacteroides sp.]|nr:hypothetical protein [Parabacteroides sp.]
MQTAKVRILFSSKKRKDVFPFLHDKGLGLHFCARRPSRLVGWKKSSSLRSGIFPPSLATKKNSQSKNREPVKNREKPSRWDYSLIKNKSMKQLQLIGSIGRLAVTGFLLIGTVLLWNKGIVPTYTIAILVVAGGLF